MYFIIRISSASYIYISIFIINHIYVNVIIYLFNIFIIILNNIPFNLCTLYRHVVYTTLHILYFFGNESATLLQLATTTQFPVPLLVGRLPIPNVKALQRRSKTPKRAAKNACRTSYLERQTTSSACRLSSLPTGRDAKKRLVCATNDWRAFLLEHSNAPELQFRLRITLSR